MSVLTDSRSRRLTLVATVIGSSLAFLEATAVTIALPTIRQELGLSLAGVQWVALSYTLALVALLLIAGGIGDRYGHRRVFTAGVGLFALTSLFAGLAPSGDWLIALRLAQGSASAVVITTSLALLRVTFGSDAGRAIGLWVAGTSIATMAGPPFGGIATDMASWRVIFFVNVPLGALAAVLARAGGREREQRLRAHRSLDVRGALLAASGFAALAYAIVEVQQQGVGAVWPIAAGGAALVVAFVAWERAAPEPMLPLELFRRRVFSLVNLQTLLVYAGVYALLFYLPLFMQSTAVGMSATTSGVVVMIVPLILVVASSWFGRLADRRGPRLPLTLGPAVMAAGVILLTALDTRSLASGIAPALVVFAAGLAMVVAPITATALRAAPDELSGIASGVNNAISRLGGLLAVAMVGTIIATAFPAGQRAAGFEPLSRQAQPPAVQQAATRAFRIGCLAIAGALAAGAVVGAALGPARRDAGAGPSAGDSAISGRGPHRARHGRR